MARLPMRQEMRMVSLIIIRMTIMEHIINMMLFIQVFLAVRRRSQRFRKSITYAAHTYSRHNIRSVNLTQMVFHSDRQCVDNCGMDRRALAKLCYLLGLMET